MKLCVLNSIQNVSRLVSSKFVKSSNCLQLHESEDIQNNKNIYDCNKNNNKILDLRESKRENKIINRKFQSFIVSNIEKLQKIGIVSNIKNVQFDLKLNKYKNRNYENIFIELLYINNEYLYEIVIDGNNIHWFTEDELINSLNTLYDGSYLYF
jgi:hypothetical protein